MLELKDVEACTATSGVLGMPRETRFCRIRTRENKDGIEFGYYATDSDFIRTMHLTLVAGTNFPAANTDQERYIVINERAAGALGYKTPGEAVGQNVWLNDSTQVSIAGVLKNFNFQPIEVDIRPLALRYLPEEFTKLQLKMTKGDKQAQVAAVQGIWQSFNPGKEWKPEWMDEALASRNGREVVSMLSFLVFICTLIAALGLLGIVSYTSFIRRKEISVRKVLGADVISLLVLLSKNYLKLILIAALIAIPIGILGSSFFLRIFAYRVSLGIFPMVFGFLGLLALALVTILSQTWATVQVNPAKNLRND
jgi:putative ABC transport system permease protein